MRGENWTAGDTQGLLVDWWMLCLGTVWNTGSSKDWYRSNRGRAACGGTPRLPRGRAAGRRQQHADVEGTGGAGDDEFRRRRRAFFFSGAATGRLRVFVQQQERAAAAAGPGVAALALSLHLLPLHSLVDGHLLPRSVQGAPAVVRGAQHRVLQHLAGRCGCGGRGGWAPQGHKGAQASTEGWQGQGQQKAPSMPC